MHHKKSLAHGAKTSSGEVGSESIVRELREVAKENPAVDRLLRSMMQAHLDTQEKLKTLAEERDVLDATIAEIVRDNARLVGENRELAARTDPREMMKALALQRGHTSTLIVDPARGHVVFANGSAETLFGPCVGTNVFALFLNSLQQYAQDPRLEDSGITEMPEPLGARLWKMVRGSETAVVEERVLIKTVMHRGHVDALLLMKSWRDPNDHPWIQIEIQEIERYNKDSLTGLFRREVAVNAMNREITHRERFGADTKSPLSVIMMDLDDFKSYNTVHGYDGGNKVLAKVASVIRKTMRSNDLACRWFSGDEFLIIVYGDIDVALMVAERVSAACRSLEIRLGDDFVSASMSIGVAEYDASDDWSSLVKRAEGQLSLAKQGGKGRVSSTRNRVVHG